MSYWFVLVWTVLIAHTSCFSYYGALEQFDECPHYCMCSFEDESPSVKYCCPTGIPDPDRCLTPSIHTTYCRGDLCEPSSEVIPPQITKRCQRCSDETRDIRQRWCHTQIGTLIGCGSAGRECQYDGTCPNSIPCCDHTKTYSHKASSTDLREAVLHAARQHYHSRYQFIERISSILMNQAMYSWDGFQDVDDADDEIDFDIMNTGPSVHHAHWYTSTEPDTNAITNNPVTTYSTTPSTTTTEEPDDDDDKFAW